VPQAAAGCLKSVLLQGFLADVLPTNPENAITGVTCKSSLRKGHAPHRSLKPAARVSTILPAASAQSS
jgi:hypothetical protein